MSGGILDGVSWPGSWQTFPFGRLVDRRKESGSGDRAPLSVFLDVGVVPRASREDNYNRLGADLGQYLLVEPGDIVFNKLRTWQGGVGASEYRGIVSPAYFVCRPREGLAPRFLHYALRSTVYLQELTRISKWMPPAQFDIAWDDLRAVLVRVPSTETQHVIADYLDAETVRIDALVEARRRMLELVAERLDGLITSAFDRPDWRLVPLKWITRATVGIVIRPAELYADVGLPCLRGFNVRPGVVSDDDLAHISDEANAANAKSILGAGDVVVVRTGNAGAAAVVPDWAVGGNCVDLLIVRRTQGLQPRFLETVLNSAVVRRQIEEQSVGALQAHFNTESLAGLRVPMPALQEQVRTLAAIDGMRERAASMRAALTCQIALLLERRQALITAAVTGQLEIPGVAA